MEIQFSPTFFAGAGRTPEIEAGVMGIAEAAAALARASAPVDTRAYRDGIRTRLRRGRGRSVARVEFTDGKTLLIESKTGNAYRALRAAQGRR